MGSRSKVRVGSRATSPGRQHKRPERSSRVRFVQALDFVLREAAQARAELGEDFARKERLARRRGGPPSESIAEACERELRGHLPAALIPEAARGWGAA